MGLLSKEFWEGIASMTVQVADGTLVKGEAELTLEDTREESREVTLRITIEKVPHGEET